MTLQSSLTLASQFNATIRQEGIREFHEHTAVCSSALP